jgi:hypothetical protein
LIFSSKEWRLKSAAIATRWLLQKPTLLLAVQTLVRAATTGVASALVVACQKYEAGILVNASDEAVEIRYAMRALRVNAEGPPVCGLPTNLPQIRLNFPRSGDVGASSEWRSLSDVRIDEKRCEATFALPAGAAAKVFENSLCDDHKKHRNGVSEQAYVPQFEYLVVAAGHPRREWIGWAAVERFYRNRSGHCFFEYR